MKCPRGFDIQVLQTSYYYIGTIDPEEGPNCRISEYFEKKHYAEHALLVTGEGYLKRAENEHCCPDCPGYPIYGTKNL